MVSNTLGRIGSADGMIAAHHVAMAEIMRECSSVGRACRGFGESHRVPPIDATLLRDCPRTSFVIAHNQDFLIPRMIRRSRLLKAIDGPAGEWMPSSVEGVRSHDEISSAADSVRPA